MAGLTQKQRDKISKNLHAFEYNFGSLRIEKDRFDPGAFYVYFPADSTAYMQRCENISYLNGWLYGVVQGAIVRQRCGKYQFVMKGDQE